MSSNTNDIFTAVGTTIDELDSLDYYFLEGSSLVYKGSFPLNKYGYVGITNIAIFKNKRLISISYTTPNVNVVYQFDSPPMLIERLLLNNDTLYCNRYTQSIFHLNPDSNNK